MRYSISKVERILGISQSTLRRYEEMGLLSVRRLPDSKYRYFSTGDIARLSVFLGMRQQDFLPQELEEIASRTDELAHVYLRLSEIETEMERLNAERICWEKHLKLYKLMEELKENREGGKLFVCEALIGSYFFDEQSMYDALFFQMFRAGMIERNFFRLCCFFLQDNSEENDIGYRQAYCMPLELMNREDLLHINNRVFLPEKEYIVAYASNLSIIDDESQDAGREAVKAVREKVKRLLCSFGREQDGDAMTMTVNVTKDKHEAILFIPIKPVES